MRFQMSVRHAAGGGVRRGLRVLLDPLSTGSRPRTLAARAPARTPALRRRSASSSPTGTRRRGQAFAPLEGRGFDVVAESGDAAAAFAAAVRSRADVCLVDADLPGGRIEAVQAIVSLPLAPRAVVLDASLDERMFVEAIAAGAAGYLLKDIEPSRLAEELRSVAEGGAAIAPGLVARLVEDFRSPRRLRLGMPDGLTDREWEVLELLADGLTTKEIALRLRLSATTVRRHISSAVNRLGVAGRKHAVDWMRGVQGDERK